MAVAFKVGRPEHFRYMKPVPVQTDEYNAMLDAPGLDLMERSMTLSAWDGYRCLGVAGVFQIWPGRAEAWVILGVGSDAHILQIVKHARFVLDNFKSRRVEMTVKVDNVSGVRLARLLGFGPEPEGVLEAFHPDGSNMYMFARIRK